MAHNIFRIADSIWGKPHLITEAALIPILEYVNKRNSIGFMQEPLQARVKSAPPEFVSGIGELVVTGTLTYKPVDSECGEVGTSYQSLVNQTSQLIAKGVHTIVMTHSSGGGEAVMAFDTAQEIRTMATEAGVRLISYVDTHSASGSYLLAVIADEVIAHPESSVGSIGVVIALQDDSKYMEDRGFKNIFITSTPGKVPFESNGSFSQSYLDKLQEDVTRLGDKFAAHVSEFTGISEKKIKALDAQMFHAEKALDIGLVNKLMNHRQFAEYLQSIEDGNES